MPRVASPAAAFIGQRIAGGRLKMGMTQDEIAVISGIDSSNIRSYENGRAMPSVHTLVRIAFALGIEPGALLEGVTPALFAEAAQRRAG